MNLLIVAALLAAEAILSVSALKSCPATMTTTIYAFTTVIVQGTSVPSVKGSSGRPGVGGRPFTNSTIVRTHITANRSTSTVAISDVPGSSLVTTDSPPLVERDLTSLDVRNFEDRDLAKSKKIASILASCPGVSIFTATHISTLTSTYGVSSFSAVDSSSHTVTAGSTRKGTHSLAKGRPSESSTHLRSSLTHTSLTGSIHSTNSTGSTSQGTSLPASSRPRPLHSSHSNPGTSKHRSTHTRSSKHHTDHTESSRHGPDHPGTLKHGSDHTAHTEGGPSSTVNPGIPSTQLLAGPSFWTTFMPSTSCVSPPCWYNVPASTLETPTALSFPKYKTSICQEVCGTLLASTTNIQLDVEIVSIISYSPVQVTTTGNAGPITAKPSLGPGSTDLAMPSPWSTCPPYQQTYATDGSCGPENHYSCPKKQCCGPDGKW